MEMKSMKREGDCRQCHYTSILKDGEVTPTWGVSCESCHGPAADWVNTHNKVGGDPNGQALKWGEGRKETTVQHEARIRSAKAKGMINSEMIYEIATNCYGCHTVPNEMLVNKGTHKAGSDFDLVAWSQGEVRHNFVDSAGAPDKPTNRQATPEQKRRLYVVGTMVDLQFSLRNLANAKVAGGAFQIAMTDRVNKTREKAMKILAAADLPALAAVVKMIPDKVAAGTAIPPDLADKLAAATQEFTAKYDGTTLVKLDAQIPGPAQYKGVAHKE